MGAVLNAGDAGGRGVGAVLNAGDAGILGAGAVLNARDAGILGAGAVLNARDTFFVSDDRALLDLPEVYSNLRDTYWAKTLTYDAFVRSVQHSAVCFGIYHVPEEGQPQRQVGFARVVSDRVTFAYLTDVYVCEPYRGLGLSKRLMKAVMAHPDLQGLRRFLLVTEDARGLYTRYGFQGLGEEANHWLQIFNG